MTFGFVVANTFFQRCPDEQISYYDIGADPNGMINKTYYAEIDHFLAPSEWLSSVEDIKSRKDVALQSHHYLATIDLAIVLLKKSAKQRMRQPEVAHLQNPLYRSEFADEFWHSGKKGYSCR